MHHAQTDQLLEWIEVTVAVQERVTVTKAERRNEAVDGLANGTALGSEPAVILGGSDSQFNATRFEDLETAQIAQNACGFFIGRQALENLTDHQIEQSKSLTRELLVQPIGLGRRDVVEVINPYRCVDNDHGISRWWRRAPVDSRSGRRAT
jgi:hypothetical protein